MEDKNPKTERNKKSRTSLRPPGQAHAAATNVAPRAAVAFAVQSINTGRPASPLSHWSAENCGIVSRWITAGRNVAGFSDVI